MYFIILKSVDSDKVKVKGTGITFGRWSNVADWLQIVSDYNNMHYISLIIPKYQTVVPYVMS